MAAKQVVHKFHGRRAERNAEKSRVGVAPRQRLRAAISERAARPQQAPLERERLAAAERPDEAGLRAIARLDFGHGGKREDGQREADHEAVQAGDGIAGQQPVPNQNRSRRDEREDRRDDGEDIAEDGEQCAVSRYCPKPPSAARRMASRAAAKSAPAFASHSRCSDAGSESATMPAPA